MIYDFLSTRFDPFFFLSYLFNLNVDGTATGADGRYRGAMSGGRLQVITGITAGDKMKSQFIITTSPKTPWASY